MRLLLKLCACNKIIKFITATHASYAALIIKKNGPLQFVVFPAAGADMEGKFYKRYRNSILFQQPDANSYSIFWEPLTKHLGWNKNDLLGA
jgi:hypothetical protein